VRFSTPRCAIYLRNSPLRASGFATPSARPDVLADRMQWMALDPYVARRLGEAAAAVQSTRGHCQYGDDFARFLRVLAMTREG
jgi:hypothetical protein